MSPTTLPEAISPETLARATEFGSIEDVLPPAPAVSASAIMRPEPSRKGRRLSKELSSGSRDSSSREASGSKLVKSAAAPAAASSEQQQQQQQQQQNGENGEKNQQQEWEQQLPLHELDANGGSGSSSTETHEHPDLHHHPAAQGFCARLYPDREPRGYVLGDEESPPPKLPFLMIRSDATIKTRWDVWIALLIVYSILIVPVRVGFALRACILAADWWWDLIVDTCFAIDILLCFRTATVVEDGARSQQILITNPRVLAHRYLCGWFFVDLLSTIPVDTIVDFVALLETGSVEAVCAGTAGVFRSIQALRILRLVRLLKLFRFLKLGHHIKQWEDRMDANPAYLRFARLLLVVLFLSHLFACLWFAMYSFTRQQDDGSSSSSSSSTNSSSSSSSSSSSVLVSVNDSSSSSSPSYPDNWVDAYSDMQMTEALANAVLNDFTTQYLSSMYWAFTTMTTVGYGDITPTNLGEMWFVIVMEFAGLVVFGMAIASMTNILANFNTHKALHRERMGVINRYVRERGLSRRLQRRVRRFYEYYLERVSVFDVSGMLEEVSQALKNDLCTHMFRELVADLPFLQGRDASFIAIVGMQMQPFFALSGEYICRRGVISLEVYWIRSGKVQLRWGNESGKTLYLVSGQHFGQEVLANGDLKMRADVRAVTYCDLLYLAKDVLETLFKTYPSLLSELKQQLRTQCDAIARRRAAGGSFVSAEESLREASGSFRGGSEGSFRRGAASPSPADEAHTAPTLRNSTGLARAHALGVKQKSTRTQQQEGGVGGDATAASSSAAAAPGTAAAAAATTSSASPDDAVEPPPSPPSAPPLQHDETALPSGSSSSDTANGGGDAPSERSSGGGGASAMATTVGVATTTTAAARRLSNNNGRAAARTPSGGVTFSTPVKAVRKAINTVSSSAAGALRRSSTVPIRPLPFGSGGRQSEDEDAPTSFTRSWAKRKVKASNAAVSSDGEPKSPMDKRSLKTSIDLQQEELEREIQEMAALEVRERVRRRMSEESYTGASLTDHSGGRPRRRQSTLPDGTRRESMQWMTQEQEEAFERYELKRKLLIHPASRFRTLWDMFLAVFVLYSIIVVPMRIGFDLEAKKESFIFWFEVAIDFLFLADILINLRTAYFRPDGTLESHRGKIALAYCRSWFLIDLPSSMPIDLILLAYEDADGEGANASNLKAAKIIKGLRLVRLMKLLRLLKITKYLQTAQEELEINPAVIELFSLAVRTLFLMHLAACVWHWTTLWQMPQALMDLSVEARNAGVTLRQAQTEHAMSTWLNYFANRLEAGEWPTVVERYTASMYWALTTMSTIGYGDIKSITNVERIVSIVIMLVGSVIFGIVVSGMQVLMEQINSVRHRATEKMDHIKAMLRERRVPKEMLRKTIVYYHHFLLECHDVTTEQRILEELCPPLRTEVLLFLNQRTVESIDFFKGQDPTFISSVCKLLKPCFFAPHDWIFKEGELGLEMYFVQVGSVDMICYVNNQEVVLDTLASGTYFGEVAILLDGLRREASARAATFCAMFSFTKQALSQLLAMYPDVSRAMQTEMEGRLRRWRLKRVVRTVSKMTKVSNILSKVTKGAQEAAANAANAAADAASSSGEGAAGAGATSSSSSASRTSSSSSKSTSSPLSRFLPTRRSKAKVSAEVPIHNSPMKDPIGENAIQQALDRHISLRNTESDSASNRDSGEPPNKGAAEEPLPTRATRPTRVRSLDPQEVRS